MSSAATRLLDRLPQLRRRDAGKGGDLQPQGADGAGPAGQEAGEVLELRQDRAAEADGVDGGGADDGGHGGGPPAADDHAASLPRPAGARLRTIAGRFHRAAPAARIANRHEPGTVEHAMAAAVAALGAKRVGAVAGFGKSALYAGLDPDDPRHFRSLSLDAALTLAGMMAGVGARAEVFALPFLRLAQAAPPLPRGPHPLHQAAHVAALYGRTAEALARLWDRARPDRAVPVPRADRDAAVAAIDATIEGLTALRAQLLTTTVLPPDPFAAAFALPDLPPALTEEESPCSSPT